ncbi:oligosaccharide flippase family protein [Mycobacterium sp. shizuoka-1]|uniref:oligosaccharide flippase family protein n=1 Tax=Mycobacterium sp. shizuoka-1 TaxID=2039281 RepID=UPI000C05D6A1|nr:oligosaccharide flippase family protein [Mycobacterium sp. shizuoka-1]GAY16514.1 hypothetical protein MSZK_32400 [Mycobacterium sp. shizuoka-1]
MGTGLAGTLRNRASRLLRNGRVLGAASLTAADVIGKGIGLLITPYLANRMGAAQFGVLNLYVSVTQILTFAISLGGAGLLGVEYIREGYTAARRLRAANLRVSLWVSIALLVVSVTVSWIVPAAVPLMAGLLIVGVSYVQALNVLELSYYRGAQTYKLAVAGQFAFAILNVVLTVVAFEFDSATAVNRLLSIVLAGGIVQLVYALELRSKHFERADTVTRRSNTATVIRFGMSLFVHQASTWIRLSIDRFVVSAYFGLAAAGVYSVAATLASVVYILFISVNQQLQPFLYRRLKNRDFAGFQRVQAWFVAVVFGFTALYYGLVLVCFDLMFAREYDSAKALLPALLAAAAVQSVYHFFSHAAFYERLGGQISSVTATALVAYLAGLGALAVFRQVTPLHVALLGLGANAVAAGGMAYLSRRTLRRLRLGPAEVEHRDEPLQPRRSEAGVSDVRSQPGAHPE